MSINIDNDCVVDGNMMYCWDDDSGCGYAISRPLKLADMPESALQKIYALKKGGKKDKDNECVLRS